MIESLLNSTKRYFASEQFKQSANLKDQQIYTEAAQDPLKFWEKQASQLTWFQKWEKVLQWNRPFAKWFVNGKLNACHNCLDVHLNTPKADKAALIWEGENGQVRRLTYKELHEQVANLAHLLKTKYGIQKGDRVTLYLPLIPELMIATLACARIGAVHSVVFAGFSAQSLYDRIMDSQSKLLITADGGWRRGQVIPLLNMAKEALNLGQTPIESTLVVQHVGDTPKDPAFSWYHDEMKHIDQAAECEPMDSEDVLFILYTSGTTGKPKGIIHTTGGYMTHAKFSTQLVFDLKDSDVYWCTADIGWITGHTYVIYGPLSNGATVMMFESTSDYPGPDRFWEIIAKHKVSIFYTAPTAIRSWMKLGPQWPQKHNLSSLRLLGSVGEPINPEAWEWYFEHIGQKNCPIVDTWWQTETGGIMISNLPAVNDMKPGYTGLPLPGINVEVLDSDGQPVQHGGGFLSITQPWPSMARGIWGDPDRFKEVYWSKFDTYFAGDGAKKDEEGYFMVLGRVDDVLNVAGHRIGTMEVESALVDFPGVAEAAVVGMLDPIKGQAIVAFVTLKEGTLPSSALEVRLIQFVGQKIGAIAKPKKIVFTPELPKTRSGKIIRRILKAIAENQPVGDITTLANPSIVTELIHQLRPSV